MDRTFDQVHHAQTVTLRHSAQSQVYPTNNQYQKSFFYSTIHLLTRDMTFFLLRHNQCIQHTHPASKNMEEIGEAR